MFQTDSLDDVSVPVGLFCNSGEVTFAYGLVQILSFRKLSLEKYYCIMVSRSQQFKRSVYPGRRLASTLDYMLIL